MGVEKQKILKSCRNDLDSYGRVLSLQQSHDKYSGLEYISYLLNNPQFDDKNTLLPRDYVMKRIIEDIAKQPPSKLPWTESGFESSLFGPEFNPSEESPLFFFNRMAEENRITLKFIGLKKGRRIEISSTTEGSPVGQALWVLYQHYFKNEGWKRLKRCPQCGLWFVDRTRNRKKDRCSNDCTTKFWSWGRRMAEGHKLPVKKRKRNVKIQRRKEG